MCCRTLKGRCPGCGEHCPCGCWCWTCLLQRTMARCVPHVTNSQETLKSYSVTRTTHIGNIPQIQLITLFLAEWEPKVIFLLTSPSTTYNFLQTQGTLTHRASPKSRTKLLAQTTTCWQSSLILPCCFHAHLQSFWHLHWRRGWWEYPFPFLLLSQGTDQLSQPGEEGGTALGRRAEPRSSSVTPGLVPALCCADALDHAQDWDWLSESGPSASSDGET